MDSVPNDDTPKSKYDCLVEAAANSGLADQLPPIKPGTEVRENRWFQASKTAELIDGAIFDYDSADGRSLSVTAKHILRTDEKGEPSAHKAFEMWEQRKIPGGVMGFTSAQGSQNIETGKVAEPHTARFPDDTQAGSAFQPPDVMKAKEGTIVETTDKLLRCRDPKMS